MRTIAEEAAQMEKAGFNGYLVKPVRARIFHAVLGAIITRARAGDPRLVTRYDVGDAAPGSLPASTPIVADVLLVEDHEVNMKIAIVALTKLGYPTERSEGAVIVEQVLCEKAAEDGRRCETAVPADAYRRLRSAVR